MRARMPVSSCTSRMAASSQLSPGSSLPFGSDQSSYFGRCTTGTSPSRTMSPPAARTSSSCIGPDGIRSAAMGRVIHFEIHAEDPDRAQRFYTTVFGWNAQAYGGPVDYRLLTTGPDDQPGINGALLRRQGSTGPADGQPVNAYVCTISVDSLDETERAVPEAGGRQVV